MIQTSEVEASKTGGTKSGLLTDDTICKTLVSVLQVEKQNITQTRPDGSPRKGTSKTRFADAGTRCQNAERAWKAAGIGIKCLEARRCARKDTLTRLAPRMQAR